MERETVYQDDPLSKSSNISHVSLDCAVLGEWRPSLSCLGVHVKRRCASPGCLPASITEVQIVDDEDTAAINPGTGPWMKARIGPQVNDTTKELYCPTGRIEHIVGVHVDTSEAGEPVQRCFASTRGSHKMSKPVSDLVERFTRSRSTDVNRLIQDCENVDNGLEFCVPRKLTDADVAAFTEHAGTTGVVGAVP